MSYLHYKYTRQVAPVPLEFLGIKMIIIHHQTNPDDTSDSDPLTPDAEETTETLISQVIPVPWTRHQVYKKTSRSPVCNNPL